MGSYLSEPITEKISAEELSELLACGSSSMQGWRVSQEDAHNCILDYDKNTSFFAVYDGHGGHEVALYCSEKLPNYLKSLELYKNGDVAKALEETFLGFDATIATPDVIKVLKEMAKDKNSDDESDEDEENVNHLYEEASMPIEQVIEKYTSNLLGRQDNRAASLKDDKPSSPFLKAKSSAAAASLRDGESSGVCSSTSGSSSSTSVQQVEAVTSSSSVEDKEEKVEKQENGHKITPPKIVVDSTADSDLKDLKESNVDAEVNNGEKPTTTTTPTTPTMENGSPKKGKACKNQRRRCSYLTFGCREKEPARTRPQRTVKQMYAKLLDIPPLESDSEDDDDDNDKTFEDPTANAANDSDDDDDADGVNNSVEDANSSEEDADEEEDDDEEDEYSDEDAETFDEDETAATAFAKTMIQEPGSDSGCTAVVALLKEDTLYVANAGDSRCIVCRGGKAIDMSFDHKPEDQIERDRIVKAGGRVTADGRVNGGLNLSRAIGDHAYKQNKELDAREQMITALPDIKTLKIEGEDEFMVLACDGIWNFMSSQEVVDFVRPAIKSGTKLSKICEEMFDHCLAPNTMGDGTGCDNMTAIIVEFRNNKSASAKRPASESEEADSTKRAKTEEADELPSTTST
ncbi:LOW QUALITY PROTEIN: probable protein phosphatase CG10417 [Atheta coriaria]|uniref:LOW QUALITY PROTEIN: probable protein phosphatase CG10417 n=1 Tax=Dalotia coriaria TaxID=877792 RepID=UPI0031F3CF7D